MPADVRADLPSLESAEDNLDFDTVYAARLFCPYGRYTLFVTGFDGDETLFGYCVSPIKRAFDEWGYASLGELAEAATEGGTPLIERDRSHAGRSVRAGLAELGV